MKSYTWLLNIINCKPSSVFPVTKSELRQEVVSIGLLYSILSFTLKSKDYR